MWDLDEVMRDDNSELEAEGTWWWEVREGVFTGVAHGEVKRVAIKKEG